MVAGSTPAIAFYRRPIPVELWLLAVGLFLCIGVAIPGARLGPDRFIYPKEFVFQLFALAAGLAAMKRTGLLRVTRLDLLLTGFLGWNVLAVFGATNRWWAWGAVGHLAAGLTVFWVTRSLRDQGYRQVILGVISLAVVIVAGAALLEAYGGIHVSYGTRVPGGVLGNRNHMAHILVLGTPALLLFAIGLRRRSYVACSALALTAITIPLVLSRTRGAWLSGLAAAAFMTLTLPLTWDALRAAISPRRIALWIGAAGAGLALALALPNALHWRSKAPYRQTLSRLLDYDHGSGRGRVRQNTNTIEMIRDHPLLGVGPGNWRVAYVYYAPPGDPTHKPEYVVPVWRYPNGEWIGTAAEAGVPGAAALLVAGGLLLRTAWRRMRSRADHDAVLDGLTLACTLIVVACIGAVDSIIRTPAGGFLAFVILGLFAPRSDESLPLLRVALSRRVGILCLLLGLGPAVALSARQLASALVYGRDATPASLTRALALHPGDYRAHTLLARTLVEQHRCDLARPHIERARMLYPSATLPRQLWVRCTPGCSSPPPCLEVPGCE